MLLSFSFVKAKFKACLESHVLNFYASRLALVQIQAGHLPAVVRYCPAMVAKKAESATNKAPVDPNKPAFNPFLPYDHNLEVVTLPNEDYALIFNKFCIIPEHLLVVTKAFVPQGADFCTEDFRTVDYVLERMDDANPLAFYNSGPTAGASQRHRHFQVISTENIPVQSFLEEQREQPVDDAFTLSVYSFRHGCIRRPQSCERDWHFKAFERLRSFCLRSGEEFNLLWTRNWMLIVPRKQEFTNDGVDSINAMAFAGFLLVMDEKHMQQFDVVEYLQQVTFPKE